MEYCWQCAVSHFVSPQRFIQNATIQDIANAELMPTVQPRIADQWWAWLAEGVVIPNHLRSGTDRCILLNNIEIEWAREQLRPPTDYLGPARELRARLDDLGDPTRWRTVEGGINWTRIGTMAVGGAIVGTAAGVLTNRLVANSQINRGQENIQCVFGGGAQTVPFGTTFMVQ